MKVNAVFNYNVSREISQNRNKNVYSNSRVSFCSGIKVNNEMNTEVVKIFKSLAKIPSPSLGEEDVANWIMKFCQKNKIYAEFDKYRNVRVIIPATDTTKKPILLSAHMDVVGDNSKVKLVTDGDFIRTDGTRTLGADDKAGIAASLKLAKEIVRKKIKHGGVEMLFTRDEELGFTGIKNVDFQNINSKYVLVLDEAKFGKFDNSGAGYTTVNLTVETRYGGHSGMDIGDKKRINAAKAISDLIAEFPQGEYYNDGKGSVASINVGTIIAGDIQNVIAQILEGKIPSKDVLVQIMKNAVTNVINRRADAALSIRSSSKAKEMELRQLLTSVVDKFNKKNQGLAKATLSFDELIPVFEKSQDSTLEKVYNEACNSLGIEPSVGTFPAGAETHIIANQKNKDNENFVTALLGVADIENMHSPLEKINIASLNRGYELLKEMFLKFNSKEV